MVTGEPNSDMPGRVSVVDFCVVVVALFCAFGRFAQDDGHDVTDVPGDRILEQRHVAPDLVDGAVRRRRHGLLRPAQTVVVVFLVFLRGVQRARNRPAGRWRTGTR